MLTPFMVPTKFGINNIAKIKGPFINMLTNFDKIIIETACRWQKYLCRHAADVDLVLEHVKLDRLQKLKGSQDRQIETLEATSKITIHFKVNFIRRSNLQFPGQPD